jgi:hypothetical protein
MGVRFIPAQHIASEDKKNVASGRTRQTYI